MTWEIVAGILTLLGSAIAICTIVSNNTKAMTEVKCSIDALNTTVKGQGTDIRTLSDTVNQHETRITLLEKENTK